jgi:hypothetical protein
MLYRNSLHRLTGLAGAAVLAAGLLAGAGFSEPRPAAAQGPLLAPDLTVALAVSPAAVEPRAEAQVEATVRFRNGRIGPAPQYAGGPVEFEVQLPAGSTFRGVTHSRPLGGYVPCRLANATTLRCRMAQLSDQDPVTSTVSLLAPAALGTHTVSARVDPQNTVEEFAEGNNTASATLRVRHVFSIADAGVKVDAALRDLTLDEVQGGAGPVLRLPDLTIRRVSPAQQQITPSQTADVEFEVENAGGLGALGVVVQAVITPGLAIQSANLSGNACSVSGQTWTCTVNLPANRPPVKLGLTVSPRLVNAGETVFNGITAEIDPANAILESNEGNNTATATVAVR